MFPTSLLIYSLLIYELICSSMRSKYNYVEYLQLTVLNRECSPHVLVFKVKCTQKASLPLLLRNDRDQLRIGSAYLFVSC